MKIMIVEDQPLVRQGIACKLSHEPEVEIVGEAGSGQEAIEGAQVLKPEFILMDVVLPGELSGAVATRRILWRQPSVRVLALSGFDDPPQVLAMLKAGACAYVLKAAHFPDLMQALREVAQGRMYLSPGVTSAVVGHYLAEGVPKAPSWSCLSRREREILVWLAQGQSISEIAAKAFIARKTAERHRRVIMKKLDLKTMVALVHYAQSEHLIP